MSAAIEYANIEGKDLIHKKLFKDLEDAFNSIKSYQNDNIKLIELEIITNKIKIFAVHFESLFRDTKEIIKKSEFNRLAAVKNEINTILKNNGMKIDNNTYIYLSDEICLNMNDK